MKEFGVQVLFPWLDHLKLYTIWEKDSQRAVDGVKNTIAKDPTLGTSFKIVEIYEIHQAGSLIDYGTDYYMEALHGGIFD